MKKLNFTLLLHSALSIPAFAQTITVDGLRTDGEYTGTPTVQTIATGWGNGNYLGNLQMAQVGPQIYLHLAGRATNNAILLFLDTKPGGRGFIPNNVVVSGGEANTLNNLGTSTTAGLTFEADFQPDFALRIFGNAAGEAHVNTYNLGTGVRAYAGNSGAALVTQTFLLGARTVWADVAPENYASAASGVELSLGLNQLGVPEGLQTVKVMAVLVNGNSDYGSNQILASRADSTDIAGLINAINFESESGLQTIPFAVNNEDSDGDGQLDSVDPDDDNDTLLDVVETNTGSYVSAADTGTDPKSVDSDDDTFRDEAEVDSTAFGYFTDPNVPNHTSMATPGNFTSPAWKEDGSAGNAMVRQGTDLGGQYRWALRYRFSQLSTALEFKYAANGTWTRSWGRTETPGLAAAGGENFQATIAATGMHEFLFDSKALTYSFLRQIYATPQLFLEAYGLQADPAGDADGDGLSNEAEQLNQTDPLNRDTDGDTLADDQDAAPLVALTAYEAWALFHALTGPDALPTADPDGDKHTNRQEFLFGTPPRQAGGALLSVESGVGEIRVVWLARAAGTTYLLQQSESLEAAVWPNSLAAISDAPDQTGAPAGYVRKVAVQAISSEKLFFRVLGTEG